MRGALVLWVITVIARFPTECNPIGPGFPGYPPYQGFVPPLPQGIPNFPFQQQQFPAGGQQVQQVQQLASPGPVDSYAPPPSGTQSLPPTTQVIQPLPPLLPSSVLKQIMHTLPATSPSAMPTISADFSPLPAIPTIESARETLGSYNTLESNATLYAAGVLSSLLHSGVSNFPSQTTVTELDSRKFNEHSLNKTNLVIIKSEKRAYLLPSKISERLEHGAVQGLYEQKEKLDGVYTVNQFLFIVKPINVNFLNKLV